jgi:AbrB family looped-hinge helix DNA binding protein
MTISSTVTTKGQVTIPQEFREMLNIKPGQKVQFSKRDSGELSLKPIPDFADMRGYFKTNIKFDKKKARAIYVKDLIAGKI